MDVDAGHRQIALYDEVKGFVQNGLLGGIQGDVSMLNQVPIREKRQFPAQQSLVVRRQHSGLGGQLPVDQCVNRLHVQIKIGFRNIGVDDVHHRFGTQVGQQHEALRLVPSHDVGHLQTGGGHQIGHFDEGFAIFLAWRGVHDDEAGTRGAVHPEIAPEARICRGRAHAGFQQALRAGHGMQPVGKRSCTPCIVPNNGRRWR